MRAIRKAADYELWYEYVFELRDLSAMDHSVELVFRSVASVRNLVEDPQAQGTETRARLTIVGADELLAIDAGDVVDTWSYREQLHWSVDRARHSYRREPLVATAHDRVAALGSALHVREVLRAGGSEAFGDVVHLESSYGVQLTDETPSVVHEESAGTESWSIAGVEVASVRWSEHAIAPDMLRRVLAYRLPLHPVVAQQVAARAQVPASLRVKCVFPACHAEAQWTLDSFREQVSLAAPQLEDCERDAPIDEAHALARRPAADGGGNRRIEAAREALAAGRLLEALLATFAHTFTTTDMATDTVKAINARASWWTPTRRLMKQLMSPGDAHAPTFDRFRKHAGAYAHVLDVFAGEDMLRRGHNAEASSRIAGALVVDPGLASAWASLGETYMAALAFGAAWECFERAKSLCVEHPVVQAKVIALERDLRERHPQLF
jgi:hypothetical protein